jgi:prepilin-type N-terminal cleavage/methylation domain-containing protein
VAQSNNRIRQRIRCGSASGGAFQQGFTLLELLLAVSLVLMLMGAVVFNFSNLLRGNQLEQGTTRLETLMRFARAQAANSGRKVQLVFNAESTNTPAASTGEVRATWESDPLGQPGCYSELGEAQWHVGEINQLVQVESVKLLEASAASPSPLVCEDETEEEAESGWASKPMPPITFYPDGSSDSAEIIVTARSAEEDQRMAVRLVGITGSISHQLRSADLEDFASDAAPVERTPSWRRDVALRSSATEQETVAPMQANHSLASATRPLSTAARATIGGTNSVEQSD